MVKDSTTTNEAGGFNLMNKAIESERFQVSYVAGETQEYPHVVDTESRGNRIISFGAPEGQNSLFEDPEKAEKAARLLNSGVAPEKIDLRDL